MTKEIAIYLSLILNHMLLLVSGLGVQSWTVFTSVFTYLPEAIQSNPLFGTLLSQEPCFQYKDKQTIQQLFFTIQNLNVATPEDHCL